MYMLVVITN